MSALCLSCGAHKRAALIPCEACGHVLADDEDRARHLIAAERGIHPAPDPDEVAEVVAALDEATPLRVAGFALLVGMLPFLVVAGVLGLLAWALTAL